MILALTTILLVSYYVLISNTLASQNYQMRVMNEELTVLMEEHSSFQKTETANLDELAAFAQTHNMVEAVEVAHMSETNNVARR